MKKPRIIVICGPTASGKTELSLQVAKKLSTEIISADSMNIYRGLDIGTAKPTKTEQQTIKHHLIDIVNADCEFSVEDYKKRANYEINKLLTDGKIPIICGGTGFYINSILYDFSYGNGGKNQAIRDKYNEYYQKHGAEKLFEELKKVDKLSAEKLHTNDVKRVIRALEIFETTGVKKSDIIDEVKPLYNYFAYSIDYPRNELYKRIDLRVDKMIDYGLIDEVKGLLNSGITLDNQCMQGIGYKETAEFILSNGNIRDLADKIKLNTRHYAKRQITFFKRLNVKYLQPINAEKNAEIILNDIL